MNKLHFEDYRSWFELKRKERNQRILYTIGALLFLAGFIYAMQEGAKGTREYNRHMCVDVYGLDEQCQPIK